jgi:transposase
VLVGGTERDLIGACFQLVPVLSARPTGSPTPVRPGWHREHEDMRMASQRIAHQDHAVTIGVDTHGDVHVAAAFTSDLGRPLGHLEIETTPDGYRRLLAWARRLGSQPRFGIQGTGSYGAGLARVLRQEGCEVIEVNRPNRQTRHARGKSDPVDAEAAARAVLSGEATCVAKRHDNLVGMIRTLRVARSQVRRNSGSR